MRHSTTSSEKSADVCGFLVRTHSIILVQNKWFQRVSQVICDGENTQIYPKRFISRRERSICVPLARLGRERQDDFKGTTPDRRDMERATVLEVVKLSGRKHDSAQPIRRHSNGPFSATNEPFGINLSVFPITNHLGNTLESFVLHKNDRKCAN